MKHQPAQPITLDDNTRAALHALADGARQRWEGAAAVTLGILSDARTEGVRVRKADVYAAVAAEIDAAATTVTQWCNVYEVVETLIGDYQTLSFDHWRAIMTLAKRAGRDIAEEAERWAATADDHGGRVVPVDRLRAALADPDSAQTLDAPKSVKTLERLGRAVVAHDKALSAGDAGVQHRQRRAWEVVKEALNEYLEKYGSEDA